MREWIRITETGDLLELPFPEMNEHARFTDCSHITNYRELKFHVRNAKELHPATLCLTLYAPQFNRPLSLSLSRDTATPINFVIIIIAVVMNVE